VTRIATPIVLFLLVCAPSPVLAQQSVTDVLSFLLTNRSIPTGDPTGDVEAAAAAGVLSSSRVLEIRFFVALTPFTSEISAA